MNTRPITLVWFRRDLRLFDNTALQTAVRLGRPVAGVFVFDTDEAGPVRRNHRRTGFIYGSVAAFQTALSGKNLPLHIVHGAAETEIPRLAQALSAAAVVCAESYEPQGRERENRVWRALDADGRTLVRVEDAAVLPKAAVMAHTGRPYTVYAPYREAWLKTHAQRYADWRPADDWSALAALQAGLPDSARRVPPPPDPAALGIGGSPAAFAAGEDAAQAQLARFLERLDRYRTECGFPAKNGTARLSPYIVNGLLSPRCLAALARQHGSEGASAWLDALVWREFCQQALYHRPIAGAGTPPPECRSLHGQNGAERFERWKNGRTGYPIVDAAMRCLAASGWLHERLRMLAAVFLVRELRVDPRCGEAWFAEQLTDYDLAANSGGWQRAAEGGAAASSRPASPVLQSQNLDPDGRFIRRHVPELAHLGKEFIHAPWLAKESIDTHGYPAPLAVGRQADGAV